MKKVLRVCLLSFLLTGCNYFIDFNGKFNSILDNNINQYLSLSSDGSINIEDNIGKEGINGPEYLEYYSDVTNCKMLPSLGTQKMLVVPVMFEDDLEENLLYPSSKIFSDLDIAFNGTSEETGWESIQSYYYKSSYGKLDIESDIYEDWIVLDKTFKEISKLSPNTYSDPTWYVVDYVVDELKKQNIDLTEYDNNHDGFIDGIWLIYGRLDYTKMVFPSNDEKSLLWAYTFWEHNNEASLTNPKANVYCWGSYDFMYGSKGTPLKIDTHTYIHETGHMLGLDDYYDYDDVSNPSGCLDMMDYNIGDHNAYTKFLLGWIEPEVYDFSKKTYTLEPFESSGDCILIPSSKDRNISAVEEYLLVEFYTPTGLNYLDSKYNYLNKYPKMFTNLGVKIYHIDSRIGQLIYKDGDWLFDKYAYNFLIEDLYNQTKSNNYFSIFASNTPSYSYKEKYNLLTLVSSVQRQGYEYKNLYAQNQDLFKVGSKLSNFVFNDGNKIDLNLKVLEVNEVKAKIEIG